MLAFEQIDTLTKQDRKKENRNILELMRPEMSCMSQCVRKRMASSAFSVDEEGQKKKKTEKNLGPVEPRGGKGHTVL